MLYKEPSFKSKISKLLLRKLYPKADFIFPNSLGNLRDLADNFGIDERKMSVLYNAIDLDEIGRKASEQVAQERPFLINVGTLQSGKKNPHFLPA